MRGIVQASLKFRLLLAAMTAGVLALGIALLPAMPIDVLPEFAPTQVEIQTEALGLSAEEVEQMITVPLEQDLLNGVAWLDTLESQSVPGLSSIVLTFQPGTELFRARQMVGERLTQAFALPHVSKPPTMLQPVSATSRVMMVGLASSTLSPIDLSVLARWTVAPRLMGVPGVANVSIWGMRDRQLQVQVDPQRLRDQHVSLLQVMETTGNAMWVSSLSWVEASTPGTTGFIETDAQRLGVRHLFPIASPSDLALVPVEGTSLRLGDVANVVQDHQPLIGDAVGEGEATLLLVVDKYPGASTLAVTRGLDRALNAMQHGLVGV
jgi:Cu/Ag efflux pump CusA